MRWHNTPTSISISPDTTRRDARPKSCCAMPSTSTSNLCPSSSRECKPSRRPDHARFSATSREYLYRIVVSPTRPIFREESVWHRMTNARSQRRWGRNLEEGLARLRQSAQELQGEHDFHAFRSSACQARSSIKRMYKAEVRHEDDEIRHRLASLGFSSSPSASHDGNPARRRRTTPARRQRSTFADGGEACSLQAAAAFCRTCARALLCRSNLRCALSSLAFSAAFPPALPCLVRLECLDRDEHDRFHMRVAIAVVVRLLAGCHQSCGGVCVCVVGRCPFAYLSL